MKFQYSIYAASNCKEIYVSPAGKGNDNYCGSITLPCQTLNYAAEVLAKKHDVIKIDSQSGEILISRPILFEDEVSNVTFTSYNGRPTITSLHNNDLYLVKARKNISITFNGLGFYNIKLIQVDLSVAVTATQISLVAVRLYDCNLQYNTTASNHLVDIDGSEYIHFYMDIENCYVRSSRSVSILQSTIPESFTMKVTNSSLHNISNFFIRKRGEWYNDRTSDLFSLHIMKSELIFQDDKTGLIHFPEYVSDTGTVSFDVFEIYIAGCIFRKTKAISVMRFGSGLGHHYEKRWEISIKNSTFIGKQSRLFVDFQPYALIIVGGPNNNNDNKGSLIIMEVLIANCLFLNSIPLLKLKIPSEMSVNVTNSTFIGIDRVRVMNDDAFIMVNSLGSYVQMALVIANCLFVKSFPILKLRSSHRHSLIVRNSTFVGKHGNQLTNGFALMMVEGKSMKILIANCMFRNSLPILKLEAPLWLSVSVKNSKFVGNHRIPLMNGVALIMSHGLWKLEPWFDDEKLEIRICNCVFAINIPILSMKGPIRLSVNSSRFVGNQGIRLKNGVIESKGTTTTDTTALIAIEAPNKRYGITKIIIADCIFLNTGYVLKAKNILRVYVSNSKFIGNYGTRGSSVTAFNAEAIHIIKCTFRGNLVVSKSMCGDTQLSGNGGALLLIGKTSIIIEDSLFENNSASCVGDSVYIDGQKNIELRNTSFKSSKLSGTSSGTIWYSISDKMSFNNVTFEETDTVRRSRTIYTADAKYIAVRNVAPYFACPKGANVNFYPKTKHNTVTKVECNFCPDKTYTLEESYATVTNFNDSHRGIHAAKCQQCPFGATCISKIRPKTNFWGYVYNKKAHLISCPPGYCCQVTEQCRTLESCNVKRRGSLCGQCSEGYAESVFSGKCIQDSQCNAWRFWGITIAFCLWLLLTIAYLQDILAVLFRRLDLKAMLRCFPLRSNNTNSPMFITTSDFQEEQDSIGQISPNLDRTISESGSHISTMPGIETQKKQENTSTTSGLIKILFFYYQMNALLVIYKSEYQLFIFNQMKSFFNNLFTFNANSETLSDLGCPFPGMAIVHKRLIKASMPCMMLGLAGGILLIVAVSAKFIKSAVMSNYIASLKNRLLVTILQIILLGYSSLTSNIFSLLTCMSMVSGTKILFIQGNVNCYQTWQFILLSFVIVWSLPLTVALFMASIQVKKKTLTIKGFFSALMFPLPSVIYFTFKRAVRPDETSESIESQSPDDVYYPVSPTTDVLEPLIQPTEQAQPQLPQQQQQPDLRAKLLNVLASSFRSIDKDGGRLQWEPVLIAQRLVLLTLHAFLTDPVIKALSMLATVILITCINIAARPFHSMFLNGLNTMYLLFLCMSGITNSVYANIYIGETKPSGPILDTLRVLDIIELAMQLLFPCVAAAAVIMIIITKLFHLLYFLPLA